METRKQYKNLLIVGGVLVVAVVGYFLWRGSGSSENTELSTLDITSVFGPSSNSEAELAGQKILSILYELSQITIDGSVFESAVFRSLVDYTTATSTEPVGRPDPFAPLPFESLGESNQP